MLSIPRVVVILLVNICWYRSVLENENQQTEVKDIYPLDNESIGKGIVPLRGLLDNMYIDTILERKGKAVGKVSGCANVLSLPKLHKSQVKVKLKPYYKYLCIKVNECPDMITVDTTSYSDVFVVDWDSSRQMTRVIPKNLNPISIYIFQYV
ncbi:MAG: hypothetical protein EZS28_010831 [Streblomastix strix]|uniref:Uncharacterized protein n=1 Tax=Streblomastix strix TaxID=222440 RepID=A0A5J4WH00_9EUKA|nr:MAG: hypothetical protein EZS28_010831 [Streblomastix strix]